MIWYFTFGQKHHDIYGRSYGQNYIQIKAEDSMSARRKMVDLFGDKWAFQYTSEKFEGQPERYGLEPIIEIDAAEACCDVPQSAYAKLVAENEELKKQLEALA